MSGLCGADDRIEDVRTASPKMGPGQRPAVQQELARALRVR